MANQSRPVPVAGVIYATDSSNALPLDVAYARWRQSMQAATVPTEDGGRSVLDEPGAVLLSDSTAKLFESLAAAEIRIFEKHSRLLDQPPADLVLQASDNPSGPFTKIPVSRFKVRELKYENLGDDAATMAAIQRAMLATAMPTERHNALNAARPGGPHQRYYAGDVISRENVEVLESVNRLLDLSKDELLAREYAAIFDMPEGPLKARALQTFSDMHGAKPPRTRTELHAWMERCDPDIDEVIATAYGKELDTTRLLLRKWADETRQFARDIRERDSSLPRVPARTVDAMADWEALLDWCEEMPGKKPGDGSGNTMPIPKRPPTKSTRPVSRQYAAEKWFKMDKRTLDRCIEEGTFAAKNLSAKKWQFNLSEVASQNPTALDDADPEKHQSAQKRARSNKINHERA